MKAAAGAAASHRGGLPSVAQSRGGTRLLGLFAGLGIDGYRPAGRATGVARQSLRKLITGGAQPKRLTTRRLASWEATLGLAGQEPLDADAWAALFGGSAEEKQAATMRDRGRNFSPEARARGLAKAHSPALQSERLRKAWRDPGYREARVATSTSYQRRLKKSLGKAKYEEQLAGRLEAAKPARILGVYKRAIQKLKAISGKNPELGDLFSTASDAYGELTKARSRGDEAFRQKAQALEETTRLVHHWLWRGQFSRMSRPQTLDERLGRWIARVFDAVKSEKQVPTARSLLHDPPRGPAPRRGVFNQWRARGWLAHVEAAALVKYAVDREGMTFKEIGTLCGWPVYKTCPLAATLYRLADRLSESPLWRQQWAAAVAEAPRKLRGLNSKTG